MINALTECPCLSQEEVEGVLEGGERVPVGGRVGPRRRSEQQHQQDPRPRHRQQHDTNEVPGIFVDEVLAPEVFIVPEI